MRILMLLFMTALTLGTGASWGAGVDIRIARDWWPGALCDVKLATPVRS